jgi:WD40 repeat protein
VALRVFEGHTSIVNAVAFSPDGKQQASGSNDRTIRLWDVATGTTRQTLEGHTNCINDVAFSPDSKQLVSASDGQTVRLWDAATGAALQMLEGHTSIVNAAAFSPDGKQLALGSNDWTVRLGDAATGAALQTLQSGVVTKALSFSGSGSYLETDKGLIDTNLFSLCAIPSKLYSKLPFTELHSRLSSAKIAEGALQ